MSKKEDVVIENEELDIEQLESEEQTEVNEIDVLNEEITTLKDKLLRNTAELENFKRRTNEEKNSFMQYANQNVMTDLIEIVDHFERCIQSLEGKTDDSNFDGIVLIHKQLCKMLEKYNVVEIVSLGEKFDATYHQAVMTGKDDKYDSDYVIEVLQKGYKLKDRVIRPAMVIVNE